MSTVTLNWTNPTTRVDGSALTAAEIAAVDIFDDTGSGPVHIQSINGGAQTTAGTGNLTVGPHSFTVVVTDTQGHASAASNAAKVTVPAPLAAPSAVANLAATLNP